MVYFFMLEVSIRARPWPGTHEPASASARAAQRFERSENALDVVAGLSIIGLPPYHSVWCIFLYVRSFYPNRPWNSSQLVVPLDHSTRDNSPASCRSLMYMSPVTIKLLTR